MTDRVLVYRLYEAGELDDWAAAVERHLMAPGPGRPIDPWFASMPGGCFRYFDRGRLDTNERPDLLPRGEEVALRSAVDYMRAANHAAARHRQSRGLGVADHPDPFPLQSLRPGAARRVRSRRTDRDDHWLTTWAMWLPASTVPMDRRAPVVGAVVEIRVGASGQVVGVVSRARPWQAVLSRPAFTLAQDHDHATRHDHADEAHMLVYVADHPDEQQRFWSPCYAVSPDDEEHEHAARRLWPACDHTLLPEILIERQEGEATAWARMATAQREVVVLEHGRDWRLQWSVATLSQFIAGERRSLEATSAPLPGTGLYQVELLVEHVATGALRSTHIQASILGQPPQRNNRSD